MTKQTKRNQPEIYDVTVSEKDYELYYIFAEHYDMTVSELLNAVITGEIKILNTPKGKAAFSKTLKEMQNEAKKHGLSVMKYSDQILMEEYVAIHKA